MRSLILGRTWSRGLGPHGGKRRILGLVCFSFCVTTFSGRCGGSPRGLNDFFLKKKKNENENENASTYIHSQLAIPELVIPDY